MEVILEESFEQNVSQKYSRVYNMWALVERREGDACLKWIKPSINFQEVQREMF